MKTTSEMQLVPIDKLIPYINNARTHSPEQITKLRSSLREFGFINPVIYVLRNGEKLMYADLVKEVETPDENSHHCC